MFGFAGHSAAAAAESTAGRWRSHRHVASLILFGPYFACVTATTYSR